MIFIWWNVVYSAKFFHSQIFNILWFLRFWYLSQSFPLGLEMAFLKDVYLSYFMPVYLTLCLSIWLYAYLYDFMPFYPTYPVFLSDLNTFILSMFLPIYPFDLLHMYLTFLIHIYLPSLYLSAFLLYIIYLPSIYLPYILYLYCFLSLYLTL